MAVMKTEFDYLLNHFGTDIYFFQTDYSQMHYDPTYDEYTSGTIRLIRAGKFRSIVITKPAEITAAYGDNAENYPFAQLNQTVMFKCSATDIKSAGLVDENFNFRYSDDRSTPLVEGILNKTYIRFKQRFYRVWDVRKALIYQGETSAVYFTAEIDDEFAAAKESTGDFPVEIIEPEETFAVFVDEVALPTRYAVGATVTLQTPTKEGYIFKGWESFDVEITSNSFTMPEQDVYITSLWEAEVQKYPLYLDGVVYGTYAEGETVTLTPESREGYRFVRFTSNEVTISAQNTFTMPAQTVNVTSVYVPVFEVYVDNVLLGQYAENETVNIDAGTKESYTFDRWTSTSQIVFANFQSARTSFSMIAETVYVTSNWIANFWTVTVSNSYGYDGTYQVTKGNSIVIQHGSRAENYGFTQWTITSGTATGDLTQDTATLYPTSNVAVRAGWRKLGDYSVTYSGYTHAKTWHNSGDTVTVTAPAKDGYDFGQFTAYWFEVGTKKYIQFADYTGMNNPNTFTMPAGDVYLTATYDRWQYTITFKVDGSTYHTQQVASLHKVSKPADPTKEGYEFVEWRYNGQAVNFNDEITESRTYTAYFRQLITYNTVTLYNAGNVYQTIQVVSGQAISTAISELPVPSHTNFERFNGWQNPLTLEYLTLQTVISADVAYTANWTTLYSVTYAGFTHATEYFAQGETVNISAPNVTGKNFTQWTCDQTVSFVDATAQNTSFTMINSNLTVTANYADIYFTVTFTVDGSTYTSNSVIYGGTVNAPTAPTKQYYTFNEWKYNGTTVDFSAQIYEDRTYVADFTQDQYTVTYMANSSVYTTQTVLGGNSIGSFPTDPTPSDPTQDFLGWQLNGTNIDATYIPESDITLVANFGSQNLEVAQIDQTTPINVKYYHVRLRGTAYYPYNEFGSNNWASGHWYSDDSGVFMEGTHNVIEEFTLPMYGGAENGQARAFFGKGGIWDYAPNGQYYNPTYGLTGNYVSHLRDEAKAIVDADYNAVAPIYKMANSQQSSSHPDGYTDWSSAFDCCLVTYSKWHYDANDEDLQQAPFAPSVDINDTSYKYLNVTVMTVNSAIPSGTSPQYTYHFFALQKVTDIGLGWYRYEWTRMDSSYFSIGDNPFRTTDATRTTFTVLPANPPV